MKGVEPAPKGKFSYVQHIKHQPVSVTSTPRRTPRVGASPSTQTVRESFEDPFEGLPEGFLATEGGGLSASFSLAPRGRSDVSPPYISFLQMCGNRGADGNHGILVGDVLGRIDHLETRGPSPRFYRKHSHQAFVREFDCLKSLEVEEKVKCMEYIHLQRSPDVVSYLAANERTIKLFRLRGDAPVPRFGSAVSPTTAQTQPLVATPRVQKRIVLPVKAFTGPHQGPIQGLSACADGDTFLSLDDLQVFWWHLEAEDTTKAACIADIRPPSMKISDISELLTSASFHHSHGSLFLLTRSNGLLSVGDLRDPPCRKNRLYAQNYQILPEHNIIQHQVHNDILTSISDAAFLRDHYIVTRDYLSLKLWDDRKPLAPVASGGVMESAIPHIDSLYDSDAIFDRFRLDVDHESGAVITGLYDGTVAVWHPLLNSQSENTLLFYGSDPYVPPNETENGGLISSDRLQKVAEYVTGVEDEQLARKVFNVSIAPGGDRFCFSTADHLFVYQRNALREKIFE